VSLNRTRVELKPVLQTIYVPRHQEFESNQSGIETERELFLRRGCAGLNRTRVELKRPIGIGVGVLVAV